MKSEAELRANKAYREKNKEKIKQSGKEYYKRNKQKLLKKNREWQTQNKDRIQNNRLLRLYGITLDFYNDLLKSQNFSCAVCLRPETEFNRRLAVDHDHRTGEIFGLLCNHCNHRVIGRNRDAEKFKRAGEYLRVGTGVYVPKREKRKRNNKRRKRKDSRGLSVRV